MVLATPVAFSPGSVTCFFSPVVHETPEATCSKGVAINLNHGVVAALEPAASIQTTLNGAAIDLPTVRHVKAAMEADRKRAHEERSSRVARYNNHAVLQRAVAAIRTGS